MNKVSVVHWAGNEDNFDPADEEEFEGAQIRQLRNWVMQMLRVENCTAAHRLLSVLNDAVYVQGYEKGQEDAVEYGEPRLSPHAEPLWRSGYEMGFAHKMSDIAERSK